jgi:large subunit ribosomal protein L11
MAKKFKAIVRLQLEAGKANPAPPVGPALAGHGINIMAFCKEYNARTSNRPGEVLPAEITVSGSFTFVRASRSSEAGVAAKFKGLALNKEKVGDAQASKRSQLKMKDLNAINLGGVNN